MRRSAARRRSRWASSATRRPGRRSSPRWATPIAFAAWSIRQAIRRLKAWDAEALVAALLDPKRQDDALKLADEAWAVPVVNALTRLWRGPTRPPLAQIVETLAGLYRQYPEWSGHWFGTNPLAGQFPSKTKDWDPAGMEGVLLGLALGARDLDPGVRLQAIAGLAAVGKAAVPLLRARLATEGDARNLTALVRTLAAQGDSASAPALSALAQDPSRPEAVRTAALDALAMLGGPQALRARLMLVYDPKAPAPLIARALILLGRDGALPPNDVAGFLENPSPTIRTAALLALSPKRPTPEEVRAR